MSGEGEEDPCRSYHYLFGLSRPGTNASIYEHFNSQINIFWHMKNSVDIRNTEKASKGIGLGLEIYVS